MEVLSLEDVYWVEDNAARVALGKDLPRWVQARQTLPTSKEDLDVLKADLWSSVVKNSQHQDAWTWGKPFFTLIFDFPSLDNTLIDRKHNEFLEKKNFQNRRFKSQSKLCQGEHFLLVAFVY